MFSGLPCLGGRGFSLLLFFKIPLKGLGRDVPVSVPVAEGTDVILQLR